MKPALLLLSALLLAGCGARSEPPSVSGPLTQAAPASGHVSSASETLIADKANAEATGNRPALKAATVAIAEQEKAEIRGSLHPLYWLAALLGAIAAYLAYSGNLPAAGRLAAGAAGLVGSSILVAWVSDHRGLVIGLGVVFGLAELVWHYRTQLMVKTVALEHVIGHAEQSVQGWALSHHPVAAVEAEIAKASSVARRALVYLETKLHLIKAKPMTPPTSVTVTSNPGVTIEAKG